MNIVAADWERELLAWWRGIAGEGPALRLTHARIRGLFVLSPFGGLTVSTDQADGIAHFAGIAPHRYLQVCAALGLTQWRTLDLNPMLVAEDLVHTEPGDCLFARRAFKSDYALAFERPSVCFGCIEFYHCLGADREVATAVELVRTLHAPAAGVRRTNSGAAPAAQFAS